jgi:ribosomal protein L14E/L6E/L27E
VFILINASSIIPGQMVISKAGRDHGKYFIVLQVVDEQFLLLVDGDLRKVEKPKLKKIKHVQKTNHISQFVVDRLDRQEKITNTMVRKEIENLDLESNLG